MSFEKEPFPRLLADIGGTNARFAVEMASGVIERILTYPNSSFLGIEDAIETFLFEVKNSISHFKKIHYAVIAIANPIMGDQVKMTNAKWSFSIESVKKKFGFKTLLLVNDFTALAMSLPFISSEYLKKCGGNDPVNHYQIGLLGAGTGLGVSGLIPYGKTWIPLETEGGHITFSPFDEKEMELLRLAKKEFSHVSAERFLSGQGLELIYRLLGEYHGYTAIPIKAVEITEKALSKECQRCDEVVEVFCQMLGTIAGNLALTLGARGGIYIGGGIVPQLKERFFESGFRKRFEDKGRFFSYMSEIPVYVILDTFSALKGASLLLNRHLSGL